jgi:hypothetical protein
MRRVNRPVALNSLKGLPAMATKEKKTERKRFLTPPFVLSFPSLWVAKAPEEGEGKPKFGATGIWTPAKFTDSDKKLWAAIRAELDVVALANFGKAWNKLPDNIKRGLRDGAAKEDVAGYGPGTRFANMTTLNRPGVIGPPPDKMDIGPEHDNEDLIYPGCICRARVSIWAYGGKGSKQSKYKGVGIGLLNLQKLKDGERLDNRVAAGDDFDEDVDSEWLDAPDDDADNDGDDEDFG